MRKVLLWLCVPVAAFALAVFAYGVQEQRREQSIAAMLRTPEPALPVVGHPESERVPSLPAPGLLASRRPRCPEMWELPGWATARERAERDRWLRGVPQGWYTVRDELGRTHRLPIPPNGPDVGWVLNDRPTVRRF